MVGCTRETTYKRKIKASHYSIEILHVVSVQVNLWRLSYTSWQNALGILQWVGITIRKGELKEVLEGLKRKNCKQFQKEVITAIWGEVISYMECKELEDL